MVGVNDQAADRDLLRTNMRCGVFLYNPITMELVAAAVILVNRTHSRQPCFQPSHNCTWRVTPYLFPRHRRTIVIGLGALEISFKSVSYRLAQIPYSRPSGKLKQLQQS
ncbi:hypothetical protein P167DRAFT_286785 [Morchella conica CCBAS932]|uniref:Uncharacterized protein n=1 Tax=Morchella conica CCBAS932 TaxID=1392247 RepID=A0A3N4KN84_9PEZI|nr:hypothetical protein P167DRAFT_286785 [Morchella conica CCBAS932]